MNKLILTLGAKQDLAEIKNNITCRLKNSTAALKIVGSITRELHSLERYPQMGRVVESPQNVDGYRMLPCGNYLAFCRITSDIVYVDRILYGRRDYLALLFDTETEQREDEETE